MKSRILLLLFILTCNFLFSQKQEKKGNSTLDPSQVPAAPTRAFTEQNPGISATWRADGENFRANYIDPTSKLGRIIIYDKEGKVVRRENEVDQEGKVNPENKPEKSKTKK
ncbi:MAG: hypothetical protein V4635_13585 [Bacteroidota bacterium]